MDPLVRSALWVQQVITRSSGLVLSFALSGYLIYWAVDQPSVLWSVAAMLLLGGSLGYRLLKRLRLLSSSASETTRLDLELFTHLLVLAYGAILHAPGGLDGPYYPAVYALVMICSSFAKPLAAAGTIAFAVLMEAALNFIAWGSHESDRLLPHAALLGVFAFLNMLVFRAEIARIRALSRQRIETELRKMKDAARSYRLLGAPTPAGERGTLPSPDAEERLLRSGVDEIHQAV